jgi:N-carbamoylputrescine amidase
MKDLRAAAVVCRSPVGKIRENIDRTRTWTFEAAGRGATVVCFPELNLTGYTTRPEIADLAQTVPGPASDALLRIAGDTGVTVLAGMAERGDDGRIYASHLAAFADGRLGVYRKLYIAAPEKPVFTAGLEIPLFETGGVTFGIQLCYDAHFPELCARMAVDGAEVIFIPHASPRGNPEEKYVSWMRHLPARAYDNSIYVIACNQAGDNERGLDLPGVAMAFDPTGNLMARRASGKQGLLVVDLSAADFDRVRSHKLGFFLPHRRPEIYRR